MSVAVLQGRRVSGRRASSQPQRRQKRELGLGLGVKAVWTVQAGPKGGGMGCGLGGEPNQRHGVAGTRTDSSSDGQRGGWKGGQMVGRSACPDACAQGQPQSSHRMQTRGQRGARSMYLGRPLPWGFQYSPQSENPWGKWTACPHLL